MTIKCTRCREVISDPLTVLMAMDGTFQHESCDPYVFEHAYTSTACAHSEHEYCRRICKYCDSPCECECHD